MLTIEPVTDRKSKEPATDITADIFERIRENGLVVSKSGAHRNILRWCRKWRPGLNITANPYVIEVPL